MFFNQRSFLYIVLLLTGVRAQEVSSETTLELDGYIITDMSDEEMLGVAAEESEPNFLRGRELQSAGTCRATNPTYKTVCGMLPAFPDDTTCVNSQATCNGLQYPCTCSGSGETSCSYCTIHMPGAVVCQVTGSSMTYTDTEMLMTTCKCTYLGNGQVQQNCFHPTPQPVPVPTFWPAYGPARAPASYSGQVPVSSTTTQGPVSRAPVSYTVTTGGPRSPVSYTPVVFHYGTNSPVNRQPTPTYNTRPAPTPRPQAVPAVSAPGPSPGQGKNSNNKNNKKRE